MSGRIEFTPLVEIGAPPFAISNLPLSGFRRATNTCLTEPTVSSHVTHGTVGLPEAIVPAATRGSSASALGLLFNEQASSLASVSAQPPSLCVPLLLSEPSPPRPTTTQWRWPSAVSSGTALAAKTSSWLLRPVTSLKPFSYQTTHGTESSLPVKAMSGS